MLAPKAFKDIKDTEQNCSFLFSMDEKSFNFDSRGYQIALDLTTALSLSEFYSACIMYQYCQLVHNL